MDTEEERQVFIGGIQKFSNDRDFAKFIEKNVPNYEEIVTGLYKKRNTSSIVIRLVNSEARNAFIDLLGDKMYKNRPIKLKKQFPPLPEKRFESLQKLLKPRDTNFYKPTEEEVKAEMEKDLKDKLIPYHNVPYEEQIEKKKEYLREVFRKFVTRVRKEVQVGHEAALPVWMTNYWKSLTSGDNAEESKEETPQEENKNETSEEKLPCDFEGILECDPDFRNGYRNKVEFTISRNYHDQKICVGFNKCNITSGIQYVDYPTDLPHISENSVKCAEKAQTLLREYEEKYGLKEYNVATHEGAWRTLLYKESKRTGEVLISIAITRNSIEEEVYEKFKQDFLKIWGEDVVSVSIIEANILSGGYEYYDKVIYLTEKKTYTEEINGYKFLVSPQAFFQVNSHVFEKILTQIKEWANLDKNTILLDVCCGTGVIGIALSGYCKKVIGIEMIQSAIDDCVSNCELNGLSHGPDGLCDYYCGKAEDELPKVSREVQSRKIVAVVDPPRSGLHPTVLKSLRTCVGLDRIVYVSCNANSLADNLYNLTMPENKKRKAPEFRPVKYCGADLFPYSPHVECIMLLERFYDG